MEQIKLFDYEETELSPLRLYSKYQTWKWKHKYKKAKDKSDIRCKHCKHLISKLAICPSEKNYYKCELLGRSSSSATDIRLSYVCDLWEKNGSSRK